MIDTIVSIAEIQRRARAAADKFHADHIQPENPFVKGSDAHRAWTSAYYMHGVELGIAVAETA